jgi:hypothetical protein
MDAQVARDRIVIEYWRGDSERWVEVRAHEHRPVGGVQPMQVEPDRVLINPTDVETGETLESFLERKTYNEESLVAWGYPDAWDGLLQLLGIEFEMPDGPVYWKAGRRVDPPDG